MPTRLELAQPGLQYFADGQAWNALVSVHGLTMIFFVVLPVLVGGLSVSILIGAQGMPRRCLDHLDSFRGWHLAASAGAAIAWASFFVFCYVIWSPPPSHTFEELLHVR